VAYAIDNAGWLLYNQDVAGKSSNVNETVSCPLSGTVSITGSATSNNGVDVDQLTFSMTNCGVSAVSYSLTFTGMLQMSGTFTPNMQSDITFSSSNLSITGQLKVLDDPGVNETCSVSVTDTWNHDPNEVGWLNGLVCGRIAEDSNSGAATEQAVPDTKCLLNSMKLTEDGRSVQFDDVPDTAFAAVDGGALAAADGGVDGGASTKQSAAPQITNAPASMTFVNGGAQPLDLAFTDPTASRPAFLVTFRPTGNHPCKLQCGAFMCCCGCRATHRVFDHVTSGVAHYEVTTASDPETTTGGTIIFSPISCAEVEVDPITAVNSAGGAGCTPLIGEPAPVGITFGAPAAAPSGSGSSGSSSGSSGGSSSGPPRSGTMTCAVTIDPITCCSGGQCNTSPSTTTSSSSAVNVPAGTSLAQFSQGVCATVTSSLPTGATHVTCNIQSLTANSFTPVLTWTTTSSVSGCNDATVHETCNVVLQ
jgi:hypothetical protein